MSEQPKKRSWLQFHLSTAVVLMFVAAGLLWLNMTPWQHLKTYYPNGAATYVVRVGGWPWPWFTPDINEWSGYTTDTFKLCPLAGNFCAGVAVLLAIAVFLEWLIRRRERRT